MNDTTTTLEILKKMAQEFIQERDWEQFHNPKNLSMNIAVEAAEVMELFLWTKSEDSYESFKKNKTAVEDEIADVLLGILCFANSINMDLSAAFEKKLAEAKAKYPVEKVKGRADKYTTYQ